MDAKVYPGKLAGTVKAPPSKSVAHRAMLCDLFSGGRSKLSNMEWTEETLATKNAVASILTKKEEEIDCCESATTLRFMLIAAAALGKTASFIGGQRVATKALVPAVELLKKHGVSTASGDALGWFPLTVDGKLRGETFFVRGDVSTQILSGLLLALPVIGRDCEIVLTSPLVSKDYIAVTLDVMEHFGIHVKVTEKGWMIRGKQNYEPREFTIEGDYIYGAYFLGANLFPKGNVEITGLSPNSKLPDKAVLDILPALGHGLEVDVKDIPDCIPCMAVMAAFAPGKTTLINAGRLRIKENDRLTVICEAVDKLGADIEVTDDTITVTGGKRMKGGVTVSSGQDHRIAMALILGALGCEKPVVVTGVESILKSYPNFFRDFKLLGGLAELRES